MHVFNLRLCFLHLKCSDLSLRRAGATQYSIDVIRKQKQVEENMTVIENDNKQWGEIGGNVSVEALMSHLRVIRDMCRSNRYYASATYASMAADSLFHMQSLGDKAQKPDYIVNLTDVHYSCYPDDPAIDEDGCI